MYFLALPLEVHEHAHELLLMNIDTLLKIPVGLISIQLKIELFQPEDPQRIFPLFLAIAKMRDMASKAADAPTINAIQLRPEQLQSRAR